jgi:DNA-binding MarR family transcriptional regulator
VTAVPLDEDEELLFRALMRLAISAPRAMGDDLERTCGLSATEYRVLMHLSEASNRQLRMSELAERIGLSPSRVTRVVDHMAGAGLLEKRPGPDDGRSTLATLTTSGLTRLRRAWPHHLASVRQNIFDHMDADEVRMVGPILERLARAIDASHPPAPRPTARAAKQRNRGRAVPRAQSST